MLLWVSETGFLHSVMRLQNVLHGFRDSGSLTFRIGIVEHAASGFECLHLALDLQKVTRFGFRVSVSCIPCWGCRTCCIIAYRISGSGLRFSDIFHWGCKPYFGFRVLMFRIGIAERAGCGFLHFVSGLQNVLHDRVPDLLPAHRHHGHYRLPFYEPGAYTRPVRYNSQFKKNCFAASWRLEEVHRRARI